MAPCVTEEIPPKKDGSINWQFKKPVLPTSLHCSFTIECEIKHPYDEHRDYPAAYNKLLFAFEEPLLCRPFPNISAGLPGVLPQASQGHWLLILWGLG